jgi:hypothetical protein
MLTFCNSYVLWLLRCVQLRLVTVTFCDINVVWCYVLSQYPQNSLDAALLGCLFFTRPGLAGPELDPNPEKITLLTPWREIVKFLFLAVMLIFSVLWLATHSYIISCPCSWHSTAFCPSVDDGGRGYYRLGPDIPTYFLPVCVWNPYGYVISIRLVRQHPPFIIIYVFSWTTYPPQQIICMYPRRILCTLYVAIDF